MASFAEPISRLFAAGEQGSIGGGLHLPGGNLSDCSVSERIAGREAGTAHHEEGNMKGMLRRVAAAAIAVACALACAHAQEYPNKSVRVIVPYGPGGGVDTFARPIAARLTEQLGQPVVVVNRPGAGGTIGVRVAQQSPADGYTILAGGVHQPMAEPLYPKREYDFGRDFVPLAVTAVVPNILIVHPKVAFQSAKEMIDYATANPGKLTYCSAGSGTAPHIIAELFKLATGTRIVHVPHSGTAAAYLTFLGGNCDMMFDGLGTAAPQINGNRVRAVALTSKERTPFFPNVPTMAQSGGPEMEAGTWYGMWAPAGTPPEIVARLNREIMVALGSAPLREAWKAQAAVVPSFRLEELGPFVREEIAKWGSVIRKASIVAE